MRSQGISLYLNALLVALTCPCHTPLYILLLSGTTVGAFLAEHEILFLSFLGFAFPFFFVMTMRSYYKIKIQLQENLKHPGEPCSV